MLVIGLAGTIGAGKDVVSRYLSEKYGFKVFRIGDVARDIAEERGLENTRKVLQDIAEEMFKKKGNTYFIEQVVKKIKESDDSDKFIINGVRAPHDAEVPRKAFGKKFVLLLVDALPELRFKRMKKRRRVGFSKTVGEFKKEEDREEELFNFKKTFSKEHETLHNNTSLEELYAQVDMVVKKYL